MTLKSFKKGFSKSLDVHGESLGLLLGQVVLQTRPVELK